MLTAHDLHEATEEIPAVRSRPWDPPAVRDGADTRPSRSDGDRPSMLRPAASLAGARGLRRTIDPVADQLRTGFSGWWARQRDRSSRNAVVFCALLLVVAITIAWTLGSSGGGQPPASSAARPASRTVPAQSRKRASSVANSGLRSDLRRRGYVSQLEAILQQSAAGRSELAVAIRSVQPSCPSASLQPEQQIGGVIQNRTILLRQLAAMGPAPDPATQTASSLLQNALAASTQADEQYQGWVSILATNPSGLCSDDPSAAASLAAAQAANSSATSLKTQFVAAFDPIAAQVGLPTWSQADF